MTNYDITAAFEVIENELIDSMMRNFLRHRVEETAEGYLWSQWQAEQLKSLEQYRKRNAKKFSAKFSGLNDKIVEMLRRTQSAGSAKQESEILKAIKNGFKGYTIPSKSSSAQFLHSNDRKLDALINATINDLKRAETAILRMSNDKYRQVIFNAQVYANTGAATYEKAVDMACRYMLRAGLNCVEYKNGARHTLSDYAEMAIRTANKRAYLYGEGQQRQRWGISLVVVNNRRGGCPNCGQYVGRVFIDDVYSGGKKTDGKYPLLSTAIKGGLFHPRCKDSTSTYYKGITTLKPVTKEEMAEMDRREKFEAQESYYENQAKKNRRIAEYSLDPDNQKIYRHRAEVSEQKAEQIAKKLDDSIAKSGRSGIITTGSGDMALEYQRYGRNKDTLINKTYIESGEYRRKFDYATENSSVNKTLYDSAKAALKHRSGTLYEDMYWIDGNSGKVVFSVINSTTERGIPYTDSIKHKVKSSSNIITIHSHPGSMPPSASDLNSNFFNNYKMGFVACHNGKVFGYTSNEEISEALYTMYIQKYLNDGCNDFTAQMRTLQTLSQNYNIKIWEVSHNG